MLVGTVSEGVAESRVTGDACQGLRVVKFRNPFTRTLGLILRRPRADTLYLFDFRREVRLSFHTWFVPEQIDLYLLDGAFLVVDARLGFKPFSRHVPRRSYRYAVETRAGLLHCRVGSRLSIVI